MKLIYKILLVVIVLVALFLGFYERTVEEQQETVDNVLNTQGEFISYKTQTIRIKDREYQVYIADTDELRAQGLSGKSGLPENHGMIFVFPRTDAYPFWMREMRFPLDILWVREGRIMEIWENAPIPAGAEIPSHTPQEAADTVLEFPAGFVGENGIAIGDGIER